MMKSIEQLERSIEETRREAYELRVKNKRLCIKNIESRQKMTNHIDDLTARISKMINQEQNKRSSLQPYLAAIRAVMETDAPQYVQTLQAKVCQTLHIMGIAEAQLHRQKTSGNQLAMYLKAESVVLTDESTEIMFDLVNKVAKRDDFNHNFRMANLTVLKAQNAIIRMLDLQTQTSIGSIHLPICGEDGEVLELDLTRSSEDRVCIHSGDLAKHYMQQMSAASLDFNDSNSSLYVSPVSVIPKKILEGSRAPEACFPTPGLTPF